MTQHDDQTRLRHMLDHATEAVALAKGRTRADLESDRMFNLALVRLIEIVGEAASRIGTDVRGRLGGIPWVAIIGMRNRVVHAYDDVDFDVLWDVIELDLPPLIDELRKILGELTPGS